MAAGCYFSLGDRVTDNIVLVMSEGWQRIVVEVMLLLHLVTAYPIITNPPAQFFEQILNIPSGGKSLCTPGLSLTSLDFNWKRCAFRTFSVAVLLFIAETIPSFGAILDLVGASTVTLLTFVFPPYFYMKLVDSSVTRKEWVHRSLPTWERVYCWILIVIGVAGGICATTVAMMNIFSAEFSKPCYLMAAGENVTVAAGGH